MNCRTPGCPATYPDTERDRRYCERCGWLLAKGVVSHQPSPVCVKGTTEARFTIRVDNNGGGPLKWTVLEFPAGVVDPDQPAEAPAGGSSELTLVVDPARLGSKAEVLPVKLKLFDKAGASGYDLRNGDVEEAFREHVELVPVRYQRHGPIEVYWKTLLFGGPVRSASLKVINEGETDVTVTAKVTEGYELSAPALLNSDTLRTTIPAGTTWVPTVAVCGGQQARAGKVIIDATDVGIKEVELVPIRVVPPSPPSERFVVAIDFGTSKSAVMVLDQFRDGAEPQALLWDSPGGHTSPWCPSAVAWDEEARPTRFGWEVGDERGGRIVKGLKMHLREDGERVKASVVYFLSRLMERIVAQFGGDIFSDARVIFTLPVLDGAEEYESQRKLTLAYALGAGRRYGVTEDRISFYMEPECAAVDFLHVLQESAKNPRGGDLPQPGDWLCVLDMGGGTTDVTFAQFGLTDGMPTFDSVRSVGYENYAGDRVDQEFTLWCLEQWKKGGRLESLGDLVPLDRNLAVSDLPDVEMITLKGGEDLSIDEVESTMRELKQLVYATQPPQNHKYDSVTRPENELILSPEKLSKPLEELSRKMYQKGAPVHELSAGNGTGSNGESGVAIQTALRGKMDEWDLSAHRIRYLCLTGGTNLIPDFESNLRSMVLFDKTTRTMVTPEFIRLNVVRGAARRPALRVQGLLPCNIQIVWGEEELDGLRIGDVPGAEKSVRRAVGMGESVTISLRAVLLEQQSRTLFAYTVRNEDESRPHQFLHVQVEYAQKKVLKLHIVWMTNPETEVIRTAIQTIPAL